MTKRSRIYFKIKWATKTIKSATGREWLASKGIYPIGFEVSGTCIPFQLLDGYMIDVKGNILGSSLWPKPVKKANIVLQQAPTTYEVKFEFTDPIILKESDVEGYE